MNIYKGFVFEVGNVYVLQQLDLLLELVSVGEIVIGPAFPEGESSSGLSCIGL